VSHLGDLATRLAQIHRTAAEGYLSQGMYQEALPHLETAVTFAKGNAEYQNQLGFVRYICGNDQGAATAFQQALDLQPANADGWFNLGMVQYGQGASPRRRTASASRPSTSRTTPRLEQPRRRAAPARPDQRRADLLPAHSADRP
jgi:Flp pilus assembly protein TadD